MKCLDKMDEGKTQLNEIFLWLDDIRPAPRGFTHVKTIQEAKALLETGCVAFASLDHDLGACDECSEGMTPDEWLEKHNYASMPNCSHFGTGYDLVCWMEESGHWPTVYWPSVHSANAAGRRRMEQAIEREQERRAEAAASSPRQETQRADGLDDQATRQARVARQLGARRIESVWSRPDRDKKTKGTRRAQKAQRSSMVSSNGPLAAAGPSGNDRAERSLGVRPEVSELVV